jgi:hypothetical protein
MEIGVLEHFVLGAAAFDPPVARLQIYGAQFLVFHGVFDTAFEAHFLFLITDGNQYLIWWVLDCVISSYDPATTKVPRSTLFMFWLSKRIRRVTDFRLVECRSSSL